MEKLSRRNFIMLAGTTGAALALNPGCKTVNKLIPYVNPPRYPQPGEWVHYATTCRECPAGCGMYMKHCDGRATKAEGNPRDPVNKGKLCARGQSSLQGLYDPDRLKDVIFQNRGVNPAVKSWEKAMSDAADKISVPGSRVIIISDLQTGSLSEVIDSFAAAAGNSSSAVYYEPFNYEPLRKACKMLFGSYSVPHFNLDNADYIISFAADYLETWISPVEYANRFSLMHSFERKIGKAAYVGPRRSLTAANSDIYVKTSAGEEGLVGFAMLKKIIDRKLAKNDISAARPYIDSVIANNKIPADDMTIDALVADFVNSDAGVALSGIQASGAYSQTDSAAAALLLNYGMGRLSSAVQTDRPHALSKSILNDDLEKILAGINGNDILIFYNANPVYSFPSSREHIKRAGLIIYIGTMIDETASVSDWLLPSSYYLESWGDYEPYKGINGILQPVMSPMYKTLSPGDIFLSIAGASGITLRRSESGKTHSNYYDWFLDRWQSIHRSVSPGLSFDDFMEDTLREGGVWNSPQPVGSEPVQSIRFNNLVSNAGSANEHSLKLWLYPSIFLFDGHLANRGWLQEIPEPVSFISWNSWIDISPAIADEYDLSYDDVIELEAGQVKIKAAVNITEDTGENVLALAFGQGHTALGHNAQQRGINAFQLLSAGSFSNPLYGVKIRKTGEQKALARMSQTKEQHSRNIIKWTKLSALKSMQPENAEELILPLPEGYQKSRDLYPPPVYKEHRWAMVIDLQACIGCGACTAACYAENNIPVTGEEEVRKGRELTWIKVVPYRSDEYKSKLGWIPMLCQHCDAAPCEPVCPVFAAVHNEEGLNAQIYNRCIGTRYCSNNCPYKVRRFNWFDPDFKKPLEVQLNPEVTVRSRGVMEKCTFCVQRIRNAEYHAKVENRKLSDGEILTACQQTCPTNAIIFGNLLDNGAEVTRLTRHNLRRYHLLEELNTKPAVTYLKRINIDERKGDI